MANNNQPLGGYDDDFVRQQDQGNDNNNPQTEIRGNYRGNVDKGYQRRNDTDSGDWGHPQHPQDRYPETRN